MLFRADGTGRIECGRCGQVWTVEELKDAHAHSGAATIAC
jgi:hypothetical protein